MSPGILIFISLCLCSGFYLYARQRALYRSHNHNASYLSRPHFHGWWAALAGAAPVLALVILWVALGDQALEGLISLKMPNGSIPANAGERQQFFAEVLSTMDGRSVVETTPSLERAAALYGEFKTLLLTALGAIGISSCIAGGLAGLRYSTEQFQAQHHVERALKVALLLSSVIAVLTTFAILLSLVFESLRFFGRVPVSDLLGFQWSPQSAYSDANTQDIGSYGVIPLLIGTLLISMIAMIVAVPIGLMSAIYLTQYAEKRFRRWSKPLLEILAGIPTVVYGFFAVLTVSPVLRSIGAFVGLNVSAESALAAGLVMGVMIIPFMSSLSDDALAAVPKSMRDGSLALGATKAETVMQVLVPAALPGIIGAVLLSISRAIGETMIVVMAAGLAAHLTLNPLDSVTTITAQIVKLLTGDQEFESAKTLSAFALGLILFLMTLIMNAVALFIVRRFRETYD